MLTFVGLYAGATFSSCDLITGGASAPHPSSSTFGSFALPLELANGLKPEVAVDRVGLKAGFDASGGGSEDGVGATLPAEYLAPDASATFLTMPSGVRSRSERAVIWTW